MGRHRAGPGSLNSMGLKKIFPIIFILITLSLIGIIYIQVNWILTMVENKREDLYNRLVYSLNSVTQELVEQRAAGQGKMLRLKPGVPWRPNDPFTTELMRAAGGRTVFSRGCRRKDSQGV